MDVSFSDFNISKPLLRAIDELGYNTPTPIQEASFSKIMSGRDIVGIAQTGTGKTIAFLLPVLQQLNYSDQRNPRVVILVPTRELVLQIVAEAEKLVEYQNTRVLGVYGGTNIATQKLSVNEGCDIIVGTPGRLFDLAVSGVLQLKSVNKLIIDEVDVMLDLGFRHQLKNIFELLPEKRQNLMFSATMTSEVDQLLSDYFYNPEKVSIAVSGTRLENISQSYYKVPNFFTKANLTGHLLEDTDTFTKVLIFLSSKNHADKLFELLSDKYASQIAIIHSNKSQNYRIRSLEQFSKGEKRILVATDVMARGIDVDDISHVISYDVPLFPENYIHRIGRTGRIEKKGKSILYCTDDEAKNKENIELLMDYKIPEEEFPIEVNISNELFAEENPVLQEGASVVPVKVTGEKSFHKKKLKNTKTNQGGSYLRKLKKHKRPKTRGDKVANKRKNKR